MKSSKIENYFNIANEVVDMATNYIIDNFGNKKEFVKKDGKNYSLDEDLKVSKIYEEFLRGKTPEVTIYSEEGERNLGDKLTWVIDPIDGTSNYRVGMKLFATQICLLDKNEIVLSVINSPITKERFTCMKGGGAFLNKKKINVSKTSLDMAMVVVGKGKEDKYSKWYKKAFSNTLDVVRTCRILGTCAVEMSYLASGKLDLFVTYGMKIYDILPGILMVREAGGLVLNENGKSWELGDMIVIGGNEKIVKDYRKKVFVKFPI